MAPARCSPSSLCASLCASGQDRQRVPALGPLLAQQTQTCQSNPASFAQPPCDTWACLAGLRRSAPAATLIRPRPRRTCPAAREAAFLAGHIDSCLSSPDPLPNTAAPVTAVASARQCPLVPLARRPIIAALSRKPAPSWS